MIVTPPGAGTVDRNRLPVAGIQHPNQTLVTLTANPAEGWEFRSWTGAVSATKETTTLRVDEPKVVYASFARPAILGVRDIYEPNENRTQAQPLIIPTIGAREYSDLILEENGEDWFILRPAPLTHLMIDLMFEPYGWGDLQLQLWDPRGMMENPASFGLIAGASYSSWAFRPFEYISYVNTTEPRELYLRVFSQNGESNPAYYLRFESIPIDDDFSRTPYFNGIPCDFLPTLDANRTYMGLVARQDDWYRVTLPTGTNIIDVSVIHGFFSGELNVMIIGDDGPCEEVYSRILAGGYSNDAGATGEYVFDVNVSRRSSVLLRVYGANDFMKNM